MLASPPIRRLTIRSYSKVGSSSLVIRGIYGRRVSPITEESTTPCSSSCKVLRIGARLRRTCTSATSSGGAKKRRITPPAGGRGKVPRRLSLLGRGAQFTIWNQHQIRASGRLNSSCREAFGVAGMDVPARRNRSRSRDRGSYREDSLT